jgi:hypothetical protein
VLNPKTERSGIVMEKIRIADNKPLSDAEYDRCCRICDVISALENQMPPTSAPRGAAWGELESFPTIHRSKRRRDFEIALLFPNAFRDYPSIAYEDDHWTPKPDYWVRRYLRLIAVMPEKWRLCIPARFGEIGWNYNGFPINRHIGVNQERIVAMYLLGVLRHLDGKPTPKIAEIGGGAGEMGIAFARGLPATLTWLNCDLPRSLAFAATRLAVLLPERNHVIYAGDLKLPAGIIDERMIIRSPREVAELTGAIVSVPHFLLGELTSYFRPDLVFNAWSLGEMAPDIARHYISWIELALAEGGVLVEQNGDLSAVGGSAVKSILPKVFPFRRDANEVLPAWSALRGGRLELWASGPPPAGLDWIDLPERQAVIHALDDGADAEVIEFPLECWRDLAKHGIDLGWITQFNAWAERLASSL